MDKPHDITNEKEAHVSPDTTTPDSSPPPTATSAEEKPHTRTLFCLHNPYSSKYWRTLSYLTITKFELPHDAQDKRDDTSQLMGELAKCGGDGQIGLRKFIQEQEDHVGKRLAVKHLRVETWTKVMKLVDMYDKHEGDETVVSARTICVELEEPEG
ncbi:hypothetical protein BJ508DRAFT_323841 [Ascobolus immersus RN42]|uniref:Uncharacterized protein n=1 Tax=Ascobolus immersus RN42 TaxID=1160509 RepID=A0A3N4IEI6_ASCIM|nr:hypothetical protein BJ508DRAFT_323841 [Ascobolus immersus RN42]